MNDKHQRKEEQARAGAWYAILGFGALVAGAAVVLRWMPDNPFNTPSELPGTSSLNAGRLTGRGAPMLAVRPSEMGAIGAGCRVSDVALVQNALGPLRHTTLQRLEAWSARQRRFEPVGWFARPPGGDAGDGCAVEFAFRDGRGARKATWQVSGDRLTVTPSDAVAREVDAVVPGARRR